MISNNKIARVAGLVYLILIISGILNLMYFPLVLIEWDNAAATYENITQQTLLFKLSIVAGIICFLAFLVLPLILFQLLQQVHKTYAAVMVILVLVSIPVSFVTIMHKFSILTLISNADYFQGMEITEISTEIMLYLHFYNNGIQISQIFWGLWLFPLGYLVYTSGFLPKFLGIMLMLGCFGYLIEFFGSFLFPEYGESIIPTIVGIPATIGELGICLWMLIMGTNKLNRQIKTT